MGIVEHVASRCAIACAALSGTSRSASTPALVSARDNLGPCTRCVRHSMAICSANDTNRDGGILLGVEIPCRFSEPGNRYRLTDAQITHPNCSSQSSPCFKGITYYNHRLITITNLPPPI